ncbi:hypothetical protein AMELA_G00199370 [Ameiurus melas]|uniref:Uncharacterized protein n=1 Tax=Ameiurus melas TaxID=219545 RepID=A0A7J6A8Y3_AMEME|nr:hypothetical protein AMELA_G00199370 [Ameiurus melas]
MRTQITLLLICGISSGALSLQCYPYIYNDTASRYQGTECTNTCASTTNFVDIYIIGGAAGLGLIFDD